MSRRKRSEPLLVSPPDSILQPTDDQFVLLKALSDGPMHNRFVDDVTRTHLKKLAEGGLVEEVTTKAHPALGGPSDNVLVYRLSKRGTHVLKAFLAAPGDIEQLIAEAERYDPGESIDPDGDYTSRILTLYALLLRRFILRGNVTSLHHQAQFALDRFGT